MRDDEQPRSYPSTFRGLRELPHYEIYMNLIEPTFLMPCHSDNDMREVRGYIQIYIGHGNHIPRYMAVTSQLYKHNNATALFVRSVLSLPATTSAR